MARSMKGASTEILGMSSRTGRDLDSFDLLYGRSLPSPAQSWDWDVAPFGEEAPDRQRVHTVAAYPDWHAARR